MANGIFKVPEAKNEPVLNYAPKSLERVALKKEIERMRSEVIDIPMYIGSEEVRTGNLIKITPPHDHQHLLGNYHQGGGKEVEMAIESAIAAKPKWENLAWEQRAAIFLKAADLLCGPFRAKMNAATMLGQSKNVYQAEIDAAAEMADFFRFNVKYMTEIYAQQPISSPEIWNRLEHRPLEGFVFALSPFNFTSIAANLPSAPALMGNTVVWKPSKTSVYSANVVMELFKAAGLPDGVINMVLVSGGDVSKVVFSHPDFAGIHFTGSTGVFRTIWKTIANNMEIYKSFPRIVGETGGKDYIFAHPSANPVSVATAITRGAFEYQGQKCSAASRAYIPSNLWDEIWKEVECDMKDMKMGPVEDFRNFINAVIDEASYEKLRGTILQAEKDEDAEVIWGGNCDKSVGYFVEPTIIKVANPDYVTMHEELFGPIFTIFVYDAEKVDETIDVLDRTSTYALTGAIFAQDRYVIETLAERLSHTAGNFYINDKPTGAVVGQQPFGGARGSGTNDKAGSVLNLMRWVSPRTIKENFNPPSSFKYPFLEEE